MVGTYEKTLAHVRELSEHAYERPIPIVRHIAPVETYTDLVAQAKERHDLEQLLARRMFEATLQDQAGGLTAVQPLVVKAQPIADSSLFETSDPSRDA